MSTEYTIKYKQKYYLASPQNVLNYHAKVSNSLSHIINPPSAPRKQLNCKDIFLLFQALMLNSC